MSGTRGFLVTLFIAIVVVPLLAYLFVRFLALLEIWETRVDLRRRTIVLQGLMAALYSFMAIGQLAKSDPNPYMAGLMVVLAVVNAATAIRQWRSAPEPARGDGNAEHGSGASAGP